MERIYKILNVISALASISSLCLFFWNKVEYAGYALCIFLFFFVVSYISFKIYELGLFSKKKWTPLFAHIKWSWENDTIAKYSATWLVKSKSPYLGIIEFKHAWTGKGSVDFVSHNNQAMHSIENNIIKVKYPVNLVFGETCAVCYTLKTVDNGFQQPLLTFGGSQKVEMAILEVALLDKTTMPDAKVFKRKLGESDATAIEHMSIPFDSMTKSYRWDCMRLHGGEVISLRWEK